MQKSRSLLTKYPLISDQVERPELAIILAALEDTLGRNVPGDIVELGCYIGTTSIFLQRLLDACDSDRRLHVYDSFAGLPAKGIHDHSRLGEAFVEGELRAQRSELEKHFKQAGLQLPVIHKGWFEQLAADDIPPRVSFAFIDGDFYSSILASLQLVWPRLTQGGAVIVDDYDNDKLPGAARAVDEFFGTAQTIRVTCSLACITKN